MSKKDQIFLKIKIPVQNVFLYSILNTCTHKVNNCLEGNRTDFYWKMHVPKIEGFQYKLEKLNDYSLHLKVLTKQTCIFKLMTL